MLTTVLFIVSTKFVITTMVLLLTTKTLLYDILTRQMLTSSPKMLACLQERILFSIVQAVVVRRMQDSVGCRNGKILTTFSKLPKMIENE